MLLMLLLATNSTAWLKAEPHFAHAGIIEKGLGDADCRSVACAFSDRVQIGNWDKLHGEINGELGLLIMSNFPMKYGQG